jgi:1-phosphatidylinositol-4-phosphate 5-kinase
MLKSISHNEFVHFLSIMKDYYTHLLAYPHSLVARILGLHKVKLTSGTSTERIYFVIMTNVFNTRRPMKQIYDLKGSTHGRTTKAAPGQALDPKIPLKDLDWLEKKMNCDLIPEQVNLLK